MIIRGYAGHFPEPGDVEEALYDASELVSRPGFWAAHYLNQSVEDDELVAELWPEEPETVQAVQDVLLDPTAWPVFGVDLWKGAKLAVVYRNFQDDAGVDYLLIPAGNADCIRLATLEGEYEGPGISWSELEAVTDGVADPLLKAIRLLLLAPMLGDVEAESERNIAVLGNALRLVGATGNVESFAELIASENLQWEPAHWRSRDDGLMVCDAESSPRNPSAPVAMTVPELQLVSDLLRMG